jgi:hypothetical protein
MKLQENNFEYKSIVNIGIWIKTLSGLDTETIINNSYKISQTYPTVLKSNAGGYQSPSDLHNHPDFFPLITLINREMVEITKTPNLKVSGMWINISPYKAYNYIHHHGSNSTYSGIFYLKIPPESGKVVFVDPLDVNNCFPLIPNPNNLIIFPATLPHFVESNFSQEDRISIAFNIN